MRSFQPKQLEKAIFSILDNKPPGNRVNICCQNEMQDFFKLEREGVCRYFLKNQCKKGDNCEFRHEEDQAKVIKYKTKLCKNYMEKGLCKYKDQCSYAHGNKELKTGNGGNYS